MFTHKLIYKRQGKQITRKRHLLQIGQPGEEAEQGYACGQCVQAELQVARAGMGGPPQIACSQPDMHLRRACLTVKPQLCRMALACACQPMPVDCTAGGDAPAAEALLYRTAACCWAHTMPVSHRASMMALYTMESGLHPLLCIAWNACSTACLLKRTGAEEDIDAYADTSGNGCGTSYC